MSVYVCTKYPWLGFYAEPTMTIGLDGKPVEDKTIIRYKFQAGEFDTAWAAEAVRPKVEAALNKMVGGVMGVVVKPDVKQGFVCPACLAGFPTQPRLDMHKSKHKDMATIVVESVREGSRTTPSTE